MARALQFANDRLALLTQQNTELTGTIAVQSQQLFHQAVDEQTAFLRPVGMHFGVRLPIVTAPRPSRRSCWRLWSARPSPAWRRP